jgi:hypothetical protein
LLYPWGDEFTPNDKRICYAYVGGRPERVDHPGEADDKDIDKLPLPVKNFPPNGYGLYDMVGSIWQWIEEWLVGPGCRGTCQYPLMSTGARAASPDCGRCRRGEHTSAHRLCVRFMSGDGIDHRTGSSAWVFAWPCRGLFSTDQTLRRTPSRRSKWLKHGHLSMRRGHPSIHRIPAKCPTSKPDIPPARFPVV